MSSPDSCTSCNNQRVFGFQQYQYMGMTGGNQLNLYVGKPSDKVKWCNCDIAPLGDDKIGPIKKVDVKKLPWPAEVFKFPSKHEVDSCVYDGSQELPGIVECEGKALVRCSADPSMGIDFPCDPDMDGGSETVYPKAIFGLAM